MAADSGSGSRIWFAGLPALISSGKGLSDHLAYSANANALRGGVDIALGDRSTIGFAIGHSASRAIAESYNGAPDSHLNSDRYFGMVYGAQALHPGSDQCGIAKSKYV